MDNKEILGESLEVKEGRERLFGEYRLKVYNLLRPHRGSKDMTPKEILEPPKTKEGHIDYDQITLKVNKDTR